MKAFAVILAMSIGVSAGPAKALERAEAHLDCLGLYALLRMAAPNFADWAEDRMAHMCQDGEHGVVLDIEMSEIEGRSELRLTGTLGFAPVLGGAGGEFAHVAGSFTISGHVVTEPAGNYEAGHLQFQHEEWLLEPEGYGSANFRGQLTRRDDGLWQITGTPLAGPTSEFCSDLIATRFLP